MFFAKVIGTVWETREDENMVNFKLQFEIHHIFILPRCPNRSYDFREEHVQSISDIEFIDNRHYNGVNRFVFCLGSLTCRATAANQHNIADTGLNSIYRNDKRILQLIIKSHMFNDLELQPD